MCVKEFIGFSCGHCTIPTLRQCPLTSQHESFPVCKFPAERVTQVDEMCHPCFRVVWKDNVLEEERRHRTLHEQELCMCEVMFTEEERQRRIIPRGAKGKGKAQNWISGQSSELFEEVMRRALSKGETDQQAERHRQETQQGGYEYRGFQMSHSSLATGRSYQNSTTKWYPKESEEEPYPLAAPEEMFVTPAFGMAVVPSGPANYSMHPQQQAIAVPPPLQGHLMSTIPVVRVVRGPECSPVTTAPEKYHQAMSEASISPAICFRRPIVVSSDMGGDRPSSTPP
ncbi:MAG: hypothetical protein M1818_005950 [Claussenomyces sp. TS43310]|nr:MAG: hypothetical protein M1818_005950 [Claussenomyces sp. TS43310]